MFLSNAQLDLIARLHSRKKLDIMEVNISTVSALIVRGLLRVAYGTKTFIYLSTTGATIANNIATFANLPRYKDVLFTTRKAKYAK
jgi:hypothetical protein